MFSPLTHMQSAERRAPNQGPLSSKNCERLPQKEKNWWLMSQSYTPDENLVLAERAWLCSLLPRTETASIGIKFNDIRLLCISGYSGPSNPQPIPERTTSRQSFGSQRYASPRSNPNCRGKRSQDSSCFRNVVKWSPSGQFLYDRHRKHR